MLSEDTETVVENTAAVKPERLELDGARANKKPSHANNNKWSSYLRGLQQ